VEGLFARIVAKDEKGPAPLFCARCIDEVEALSAIEAETKRPIWRRLVPTRAGWKRAAAYVAVLALILVPMSIAVKDLAETPITPEELARIKVGLQGGFRTPDGVNVASAVFGGIHVRSNAPAAPGYEPERLIDTWNTVEVPSWRSATATFPQELVFRLPQKTRVNKVVLRPHPSEPAITWARDFDLLVSEDSSETGFVQVAGGRLLPPGEMGAQQLPEAGVVVTFPEVIGRYVLLRIRSNQGSADYTSLGEMELFWSPRT
jgi:hypothetical protein